MTFTDTWKTTTAKALTELAIQNNLIIKCDNAEDTAKEVTTFFNTIIETLDKESQE